MRHLDLFREMTVSCIRDLNVIRYLRGASFGNTVYSAYAYCGFDPRWLHTHSYLTSYLFRAIVNMLSTPIARSGQMDEKSISLALIRPQPPERMAATF